MIHREPGPQRILYVAKHFGVIKIPLFQNRLKLFKFGLLWERTRCTLEGALGDALSTPRVKR